MSHLGKFAGGLVLTSKLLLGTACTKEDMQPATESEVCAPDEASKAEHIRLREETSRFKDDLSKCLEPVLAKSDSSCDLEAQEICYPPFGQCLNPEIPPCAEGDPGFEKCVAEYKAACSTDYKDCLEKEHEVCHAPFDKGLVGCFVKFVNSVNAQSMESCGATIMEIDPTVPDLKTLEATAKCSEEDTDGDGTTNFIEAAARTNPCDPSSVRSVTCGGDSEAICLSTTNYVIGDKRIGDIPKLPCNVDLIYPYPIGMCFLSNESDQMSSAAD